LQVVLAQEIHDGDQNLPSTFCFLEHDWKLSFVMIVDLFGGRERVDVLFSVEVRKEQSTEYLNVPVLILEVQLQHLSNIVLGVGHQSTDRVNYMH
jgi:hypothetical protein